MSGSRFAHLLAPGAIGPMALRNRILLTPMGDRLANDDGTVSDRQSTYLEARARGGAALIVIGSVAVSYPEGAYASCQTALSEDRFVPRLRELADRVHGHGAAIAAQLVHDGANSLLDVSEGRPLLVPSVPPRLRPDRLSSMVTSSELSAMIRPFTAPGAATSYRVASEEDLATVIEHFATAADRARRAGFDGIEIHAGHGYLIDAFLSPALNQREDRWGGDLGGRARLLVEVLTAVRERVGEEVAVWCRLNAVERYREGGETPEDLLEVADIAVAAGSQAIHVSAATDAGAALGVTEAHTPHVPGLLLPFAAMVKARVSVPVIAVGRIEPDAAERAVAEGAADFVAMGRKLLADPDLPNKLMDGLERTIRPCIYHYRCIGNIFLNEPLACVANPATGHGDGALGPADTPRRILVVGGGPGGLEAGALLDERGHLVVLAEAEAHLGGTLALAAGTDETLARFLDWQLDRITRSAVELLLSTPVTAALVAGLDIDEVVVASGGRWTRPEVEGGHLASIPSDLAQWLRLDDGSLSDALVIVGGDKAGLSLAGVAARRGRTVTVLEPGSVLAASFGPPGRFRLVHDLEEMGVNLKTDAVIVSITPDSVHWRGVDGAEVTTPAGTVISTARTGDLALARSLATLGKRVHVVGDASGPRGLEGALDDARAAALAVGS